jgi:hypothetical protein
MVGARRNFQDDVPPALAEARVEDVCEEDAFIASRWVLMSTRSRAHSAEDGRVDGVYMALLSDDF